jgi:hypothetical protein
MSFLFIFRGLAVVNAGSPMSNPFRFLWASCGVTSGKFALWEKLRRGWYWWTRWESLYGGAVLRQLPEIDPRGRAR